jgi:NDP-sugar pyrophosphorylase family protein
MKAVILAGGKGTRLTPYTKVLPKPLIPIGEDMPILEILLRQLKRTGIEDVTLAVGHSAGLLSAFFQDGRRLGMQIGYSYEQQPLGTAGPLSLLDGLDDTFLVSNGDVLTTLSLAALIEYHRRRGATATIASSFKKVKIDLGVIDVDEGKLVVGYTEKPTYEFLVSMGIYVFEPRVLSYIRRQERLDFPELVLRLIAGGERVASYPYDGYWMDLGRVEDYEQAVRDFEGLKTEFLGEPDIKTLSQPHFGVRVAAPAGYQADHPGGDSRLNGTAHSAF